MVGFYGFAVVLINWVRCLIFCFSSSFSPHVQKGSLCALLLMRSKQAEWLPFLLSEAVRSKKACHCPHLSAGLKAVPQAKQLHFFGLVSGTQAASRKNALREEHVRKQGVGSGKRGEE